jgi:hypothetical protein
MDTSKDEDVWTEGWMRGWKKEGWMTALTNHLFNPEVMGSMN